MTGGRRSFLGACLGAATAATISGAETKYRMGIGTASYAQRGRADRGVEPAKRFTDTLNFLEHCRQLGAGGIQAPLASLDDTYAGRVRDQAEEAGMYVEVSARLPRDTRSAEAFEATVRAARLAGASVIRTVMLSGRRYENFRTMDSWKEFRRDSWRSLTVAEPIAAKHGVTIAVENHKDWRIDEMLRIMERIESEWVGVTLDTGNNMSLLEDPVETARALAPYAAAVHLKDMAVERYEDGFLLAEVPFGEGCLDLEAVVGTIRAARPNTRFTLEMITRDPLEIPCLGTDYWITMDKVPGAAMARSLELVRRLGRPLPRVQQLAAEERFEVEERNNVACLEYGRAHLGL